ncbi:hypothetical protein Q5P01_011405 [Channa striata]|uniref:complement subcomponent C1r n=1 Tax=Channa striata TaxID=64152 RepID=A0AA88MT69_CHASR|nr:hypothetical protein Q5P01_011405 [Channa striata]
MLGLSLLLLLFSHSVRSTLLGWVESPGYPNGYVPHASLNWSRCAPRGHTLSIRLIHLDVEDSKDCENDAVRVFSNGNLISSDYSNIQRHTGFRGFYSVQDYDECEDDPDNKCTQFCHNFIGGYYCSCRLGYYLDKDKHTCTVSCSKDLSGVSRGDISSPSWPGSYAENANCLHTLSVESHLQLELQFNEVFDVEQSSDGQCIDTLKIETPSGILGSFCGKTPPPSPFLTHSHHVKIRFTSDGFGSNKGFSFRFQTREKVCSAEVIPHSTVTPQRPQYRRGDIVTVTCDLGHVPNTKGVKTLSSEYETTCHSTGVWVPHYPCEPVDCGVPDIPEDGVIRILGDNQRTHYEDQIQFACNSQYYTLEGNDTYTCSSNGEWVSSRGKTEMPKCTPICGIPTKALDLAGRILGGERAKLGEIPWHLFIKEPSRGGATLINDRWAVTAAHVVEHTEETSLRLYGGLVDGSLTQNPQSPNLVVMESERIIIHPGYAVGVDERANFDNDIALIRLASRRIRSLTDLFHPKMGWTVYIIWFLYVSACECRELPDSEPAMYGEVKSPEYPKPYSPNLLEQWDLSVPEGFQIRLTFTHMDIEASAGCFYDSLTMLTYVQSSRFSIMEKSWESFVAMRTLLMGITQANQPILSPDNQLTLVFQSDNNNPERHQNVGFFAQYQAIDIDECSAPEPADGSGPLCAQICLNTLGSYLCSCHHGYEIRPDQRSCVLSCGGGIFDEPEGRLLSPAYPNPPPHGVSCQYVISVESGFTIALNFSNYFHIESVETERGRTCLHHWLQVTVPGREPMKLCGTESPGLIDTNSNTVQLDYHTDDDGQSNGWSLDYSTHRVNCPLPGKVANGRVTPSWTQFLYRDYIFVRCFQGYKLMMDGEEIAGFSTMCQSNGQWHLALPECHIIDCGEPEPLLNGGVTFLSGLQNQYHSVIQYHCNEPFYSLLGGANVTFTCEADRKWRSDSDVVLSPTCIPVCGKPTKLISAYQRIIGGNEAPENTIPWQVLVSIDGARGGGMVIADRWIMTAAHNVVENGNPVPNDTIRVFMGVTDVNTDLNPGVQAASVYVHPDYNNPNFVDYSNDIALIKLHDPITFNPSIMPICLPAEDATYHTGTMGLVSGFGLIKVDGRMILKNKLQYVQLPLVNQETCSNSITLIKTRKTNVPLLTNNMFCAGFPEGGKDSCQGDSGGPFAFYDNGQFWAAGIVSWGFECGQQGAYGVYTKVSNYLSWITKTIQEN